MDPVLRAPQVCIADNGNEFFGDFERGSEHYGIMLQMTDPWSPWQNGRVERGGVWIKDRLILELTRPSPLPLNVRELDVLVAEIVGARNV
eukprot:7687127-Lingulodinium_polyedra.AAC.1